MRHRTEISAIAGAAAALALVLGAVAPGRHAEAAPVATRCCFTNRSYAGVCQVQPAQDETCASILSYLNNPMSAGKAYCNSTPIRGGWRQVACAKKTTADLEPGSSRTVIGRR
jgi:hypothetical protein